MQTFIPQYWSNMCSMQPSMTLVLRDPTWWNEYFSKPLPKIVIILCVWFLPWIPNFILSLKILRIYIKNSPQHLNQWLGRSVLLHSWGTGIEWLFYPHYQVQRYRSYVLYLVNVPERETNVELILELKQT